MTALGLAACGEEVTSWLRVGTWNLEGRWTSAHQQLLVSQDCDLWLLTEVRDDVLLPGFRKYASAARMSGRRHWAAVLAREAVTRLPDPHPASVAVVGMGVTWCATVLPWRSCGSQPWGEGSTADRTERAVDQIVGSFPAGDVVWGGDWNHSFSGQERAGSYAGRSAIQAALAGRAMQTVTADLPHRITGLLTIDHIAIPDYWQLRDASRVVAESPDGRRLSDHDAYVVEIAVDLEERSGAVVGGAGVYEVSWKLIDRYRGAYEELA